MIFIILNNTAKVRYNPRQIKKKLMQILQGLFQFGLQFDYLSTNK